MIDTVFLHKKKTFSIFILVVSMRYNEAAGKVAWKHGEKPRLFVSLFKALE